jgi:hypothetical protein
MPKCLLQQHDQLDVTSRRRVAGHHERVELDGSRRGQRAVDGDLAPPGLQDAADRCDHERDDTEALGRLDQCGDTGEVGASVGDDADLAPRLSVARTVTLPRFGEHAEYLGGAERRS